jgi:hypothetical protein
MTIEYSASDPDEGILPLPRKENDDYTDRDYVFEKIVEERTRQTERWGEDEHSPLCWTAILNKQLGAYADAALKYEHADNPGYNEGAPLYRQAVHIAAVAIAILEQMEREGWSS